MLETRQQRMNFVLQPAWVTCLQRTLNWITALSRRTKLRRGIYSFIIGDCSLNDDPSCDFMLSICIEQTGPSASAC